MTSHDGANCCNDEIVCGMSCCIPEIHHPHVALVHWLVLFRGMTTLILEIDCVALREQRLHVHLWPAKFFTPNYFFELITRDNSVSHYVDRPVFWGGVKNYSKNRIIRELISNGVISELPHKIVFELNLGYNGILGVCQG